MFTEEFFAPFPPDVRGLIESGPRLLPLVPENGQADRVADLKAVVSSSAWKQRRNQNRQLSVSAESGLWLWFGFLDRAHELCQDIPTAEGSYWHGIMHRIEGDYWNAKYWMRRAGRHPLQLELLGVRDVSELQLSDLKREVVLPAFTKQGLDSERLVDLCEAANLEGGELEQMACRWITTLEWRTLMLYCLAD